MLESDFNFIACRQCFLSDRDIGKLVVGVEAVGCIFIKNRMDSRQVDVFGLLWPWDGFFTIPNMVGIGQYLICQLEITADVKQGSRSFGKRCATNGVSGENPTFE